MQECKITIRSPKFWNPTIARKNDKIIMQAATEGIYTTGELRTINNWRIYFNALRISDITDGPGKYILSYYRRYDTCHAWKSTRTSKWNWPKQNQPSEESFRVWTKFLTKEFKMQTNGMIGIKLEKWYGKIKKMDNKWRIYYDPQAGEIYEEHGYNYAVYKQINAARGSCRYESKRIRHEIYVPSEAIPATTSHQTANITTITYYNQTMNVDATGPIPDQQKEQNFKNFQDFINTQAIWQQDLCSNWSSSPNEEILQLFQHENNHIYVSAESTIHRTWGDYAITLQCRDQIFFSNKGRIFRIHEDIDKARLQWISILSAIWNIQSMIKYIHNFQTHKHKCTIYSSSHKMVREIEQFKKEGMSIGHYGASHIDIIAQNFQEIDNANQKKIYIKLEHVKPQGKPTKKKPKIITRQTIQDNSNLILKAAEKEKFTPHDEEYQYPENRLQNLHKRITSLS